MQNATAKAIAWTEQGLVPDAVIRHGIRRLLKKRLESLNLDDCEAMTEDKHAFIDRMNAGPIAALAQKANEQHYEVPTEFFRQVLGRHTKYSCAFWAPNTVDLDTAEAEALRLSCEHAGLADGQQILELGCGWGSLTLWMARHFPNSRITAISNSSTQRAHIEARAQQKNLNNVTVLTRDMNDFTSDRTYDRIVSIEMFEHMRNYRRLFHNVSQWLKPDGRFFMHIFCHRDAPYSFDDLTATDWMSRHFFSGGMMPSRDLPLHFQEHLSLRQQWQWDGRHYEKTANAWLLNMDARKDELWPLLRTTYGEATVQQWWMRWRIFFMACAELFAYDNGQQWHVSHYLFSKAARA